MNVESQQARAVRYAIEIRFRPFPLFLDRRGAIAEGFHGDPFIHWQVEATRVLLFDEARTRMVGVTHGNLVADMEAPDTYQVFEDQAGRWIRHVTQSQFLGQLHVGRIGFREWYFVPVADMSLVQLAQLISDRFMRTNSLTENLQNCRMIDNALVLVLETPAFKSQVTLGPMERNEARQKEWVRTDQGAASIPGDLSFAMDVDVYWDMGGSEPRSHRELLRWIRQAHDMAEQLGTIFANDLEGAQ